MASKRLAGVASLAFALALVAAACGVDGPGSNSSVGSRSYTGARGVSLLRASARSTTDAKTAKFEMTFRISGFRGFTGRSSDVDVKATGAFDIPAHKARLKVDLGSLFSGLFGRPGSDTIPPGSGEVELILVGGTAYLNAGTFQSLYGGSADKPWIKTDAGGANGAIGSYGSSDPSQFLTFLRSVSGDIKKVGEEEVRGTATQHLHTTIDLPKLVDRVPRKDRAKARNALAGLGKRAAATLKSVPADVWVDKDNLVRRFSMTYAVPASSSTTGSTTGATPPDSAKVTTALTIEFFDFGKSVDISPPPADQVSAKRLNGFDKPGG